MRQGNIMQRKKNFHFSILNFFKIEIKNMILVPIHRINNAHTIDSRPEKTLKSKLAERPAAWLTRVGRLLITKQFCVAFVI